MKLNDPKARGNKAATGKMSKADLQVMVSTREAWANANSRAVSVLMSLSDVLSKFCCAENLNAAIPAECLARPDEDVALVGPMMMVLSGAWDDRASRPVAKRLLARHSVVDVERKARDGESQHKSIDHQGLNDDRGMIWMTRHIGLRADVTYSRPTAPPANSLPSSVAQ